MAFIPSVEIELGDSTHSLKIGYGELYEFERVFEKGFLEAFGGSPSIRAVVILIRIGLKWKFKAKEMNERKITNILNEHPEQFIKAVEKIAEIADLLFPTVDEDGDGEESTGPLPKAPDLEPGG